MSVNLKNDLSFPLLNKLVSKLKLDEKKGTNNPEMNYSIDKNNNKYNNKNKKEIPLYLTNPTTDRLFHAYKCLYKDQPLNSYFKDVKLYFDISENEIKSAIVELKNFLEISEEDFENDKNKDNPNSNNFNNDINKFHALIRFYYSFIYQYNTEKILSNNTLKTIRKNMINRIYSVLNTNKKEEFKLNISEFHNLVLKQFNNAVKDHKSKILIKEKKEKARENSKKYSKVKFKVLFGHDTLIMNLLKITLNEKFLHENLQKLINDSANDNDNIFNFFIPEFGSFFIYELYYDDEEKFYYVKIIYNGLELNEELRIIKIKNPPFFLSSDKYKNMISYERFKDLMDFGINKEYHKLVCGVDKKKSKSKDKANKENL
jgi:hypothetical protein